MIFILGKKFFKKFLYSCIISLLCLYFIFSSPLNVEALNNVNSINDSIIYEELKLTVPKKLKNVWLKAEKLSWEPWLKSQDGFINRRLFWDSKKEEATLLIEWESKKLWKSISEEDINKAQTVFEDQVKLIIGNDIDNPFKLVYEGELVPQK